MAVQQHKYTYLAMNCIFKNSENGKFYMYFTKIKNWKTDQRSKYKSYS